MEGPHKDSKFREAMVLAAHRLPCLRGTPAGTRGIVSLKTQAWPCVMGAGAVSALKREGDRATPLGRFALRYVLYRPDRVGRPRTALPARPIKPSDGWCDGPGDRNYNRAVPLPYPASTEALWRQDGLYDVVVVLGHNDRPRIRGHGSAIFMHVMAPERGPTQGCVALALDDLLQLIACCGAKAWLAVYP